MLSHFYTDHLRQHLVFIEKKLLHVELSYRLSLFKLLFARPLLKQEGVSGEVYPAQDQPPYSLALRLGLNDLQKINKPKLNSLNSTIVGTSGFSKLAKEIN